MAPPTPTSATAPAPAPTAPVSRSPKGQDHFHFQVRMTCSGCSSAIERVLRKNSPTLGLVDFSVDLEKQTVDCFLLASKEDQGEEGEEKRRERFELVKEIISKTGKVVLSGEIV